MALKAKAPKARPGSGSALKKVPLRVRAEGAKEVVRHRRLHPVGEGQGPPDPRGGGEWITQLELAPGEYQYRLIVDGEWRDHAEAARASRTRSARRTAC
jgi:hypothetical protein